MAQYDVAASNDVGLTDDPAPQSVFDRSRYNNLLLSQTPSRQLLTSRDGEQTATFTHGGICFRAVSNILTITDDVSLSDNISSGAAFSDMADAYVSKSANQTFTISDSVIREPMTFVRGTINTSSFSHFASVFNTQANPHGDCTEGDPCTRSTTTLSYGLVSVDLRNPEDDSLVVVQNLINRYTRVHPRFLQLKYTFTNIPASQKNEFVAFYKLTAGLEIHLIDHCNQEWVGCILDHDIDINREEGRLDISNPLCPETDDGLYTFTFVFEGERVP